MNESCITGLSPSRHCGAAACCSEPYDCCAACPEKCNSRCGWLGEEPNHNKETSHCPNCGADMRGESDA